MKFGGDWMTGYGEHLYFNIFSFTPRGMYGIWG